MADIYIAKDGDRIDLIVYENYKSTDPFETVLKSNKHLIKKTILSAGDKVYLPKIENKPKIKEIKSLW